MSTGTLDSTGSTGGTASTAAVSAGTEFARVFATDGERIAVTFGYTVTDAHKPDRPKPRLTVRGLLKRRYADSDYGTGILAACDEIEQTGSTAHAMIVNPRDYYLRLVGGNGLLADLAGNGTLISRTRMISPGCALVGDFAEAVRLLDAGRSVIRVAEPPPGTFATPGLAVCGEVYEGIAVHLPTHLFFAVPADGPDS